MSRVSRRREFTPRGGDIPVPYEVMMPSLSWKARRLSVGAMTGAFENAAEWMNT